MNRSVSNGNDTGRIYSPEGPIYRAGGNSTETVMLDIGVEQEGILRNRRIEQSLSYAREFDGYRAV
jgi:hypothetical protein